MTAGITLSDDDRRQVTLWTADCAERGLPLFEAIAPADTRPHLAIEGAREFGLGGGRTARLRTLAFAAYAAAREIGDPVATAAARAAGHAAGSPYIHALADADQTKHALGSAQYQALARELAAGNDPSVGDEEIRWALERASPEVREVVSRFPLSSPGRSRLAVLRHHLDLGLRQWRCPEGHL